MTKSVLSLLYTVKPVFKTTWEIGTAWELRTATSVPTCRSTQYIHCQMDLGNKTTAEFRTDFDSPLAVPNSQVKLYVIYNVEWNIRLWNWQGHLHDKGLLKTHQWWSLCLKRSTGPAYLVSSRRPERGRPLWHLDVNGDALIVCVTWTLILVTVTWQEPWQASTPVKEVTPS